MQNNMFGKKTETAEDIAEKQRKQDLRARARSLGNEPASTLTKREKIALELASRLSPEYYEDVTGSSVELADQLLLELAK